MGRGEERRGEKRRDIKGGREVKRVEKEGIQGGWESERGVSRSKVECKGKS